VRPTFRVETHFQAERSVVARNPQRTSAYAAEPEYHHEQPVHDALKVTGQTHPRVGNGGHDESHDRAEQMQRRAYQICVEAFICQMWMSFLSDR
jgi:hypothetical protein